MKTEDVGAMSQFINEYGFLVVFGAVMLIAIATVVVVGIKMWNKRESAKLASERERAKVELELVQKERMSSLEQNKHLFNLVTDVQTEQISQMKNISLVIDNLKNEVMQSVSLGKESKEISKQVSSDVGDLKSKLDKLIQELNSISAKVDTCCTMNNTIIDSINQISNQGSTSSNQNFKSKSPK